MFTQPHIGNVGINKHDNESNRIDTIWSKGIVIKSLSLWTSNWRAESSLNNYLIAHNIIGIANLDTRELTNILRNKGSQRSCIYIVHDQDLVKAKQQALNLIKSSRNLLTLDLAKEVTTVEKYTWQEKTYKLTNTQTDNQVKHQENNLTCSLLRTNDYNIVVYDFGVKQQILKLLADRRCHLTVVPADFSVDEVLALKPHGIVLSNGPGDPAACDYAIKNTKHIINMGIPVFGICLGIQILALALGAKTQKMKFGHHGGNHPVKDLLTNKVLITSQNHGFMVTADSITDDLIITHKSLFDDTIQGLMHKTLPVIGFQGHPEASPGPNDIEYLFDKFIYNVDLYKLSKKSEYLDNKAANLQ
jgi:carbamoyl-phosphate synthase small subunit